MIPQAGNKEQAGAQFKDQAVTALRNALPLGPCGPGQSARAVALEQPDAHRTG